MDECRVMAPAKINLSLDITGRRHDGYHLLRTVLQSIRLCDHLLLQRTDNGIITLECDCHDLPTGADNLAVRAAQAFFTYHKLTDAGVRITLEKNIPMQAGLAGGSADAAATLVGLNALFETHLDTHALCEIGLMLGADVPFCIVGGSVLAVGIGEIFQPLPSLPKCHIVIAKPPSGISTEQAYTLFDNAPPSRRPDNDSLAAAVAAGSLAEVGRLMCNVLEDVCSLQEISAIKAQMLAEGACGALMSGSGSAVFGLFESKSSAKRCVSVLKEQYAETFLTSPCAHGVSVLSQS